MNAAPAGRASGSFTARESRTLTIKEAEPVAAGSCARAAPRGEGSPSVTELVRVGDDVDVVVIVVDEVRAEIYLGLSAPFIFDLGQ